MDVLKPYRAWERRRKLVRHSHKFAARYPYNLEPIQFATLITAIDTLAEKPGCILEVGAYRGWSTMFLCEHILRTYPDHPPTYYAIDTFDSFVDDHVDHEVVKRDKIRKVYDNFNNNDYDIWVSNFRRYPFVTAIKADCAQFDFGRIGKIKVALLDVDLYIPTAAALPKMYASLIEGGVILLDDVRNVNVRDEAYPSDGAYQAYVEFCAANRLPPAFIGTKSGVIRKDVSNPVI